MENIQSPFLTHPHEVKAVSIKICDRKCEYWWVPKNTSLVDTAINLVWLWIEIKPSPYSQAEWRSLAYDASKLSF
jgi:hypothetical protein